MYTETQLTESIDSIRDSVCQHLRRIGIHRKEAARFSSLFSKWIQTNGPQWSVDHIKALDRFVRSRIEHLDDKTKWEYPCGWATRKSRTGIKFRDGLIQQLFNSDLSRQTNLTKIKSFLKITDFLVFKEPTEQQLLKALNAVTSPSTMKSNERVNDLLGNIGNGMLKIPFQSYPRHVNAKPIYSFLGNDKTFPVWINRPQPNIRTLLRVYLNNIDNQELVPIPRNRWYCLDDLEFILSHDKDLIDIKAKYPKNIIKAIFGNPSYDYQIPDDNIKTDFPMGSFVILQERGLKPRYITSVHATYQALAEPLKVKLEHICKEYFADTIFTFNQVEGMKKCMSWLAQGCTVVGIDQSSFTDRFPLPLQTAVLGNLLIKDQIDSFDYDVFNTIVRKRVISKDLKQSIKWAIGQPMGFGPSFHIACLSHAILIEYIKHQYNCGGDYAIVGDDIVINDEALAKLYTEHLEDLGVTVNHSKGLLSSKVADFLGHWITEKNPILSGHPNSRDGSKPNDPIAIKDHMKYYGPKSWNLLSDKAKRKAFLCLVPPQLGGLGWKPPGMKYKDYLEQFNIREIVFRMEAAIASSMLEEQPVDPNQIANAITNKTHFLHKRYFIHSNTYRDIALKTLELDRQDIAVDLLTGNFVSERFLQFVQCYLPHMVGFDWLNLISQGNQVSMKTKASVQDNSWIRLQDNIDNQILKSIISETEDYNPTSIRAGSYAKQYNLFTSDPDLIPNSIKVMRENTRTLISGNSDITEFSRISPIGSFYWMYDSDILNNFILNTNFITSIYNKENNHEYSNKSNLSSNPKQQKCVGEISEGYQVRETWQKYFRKGFEKEFWKTKAQGNKIPGSSNSKISPK